MLHLIPGSLVLLVHNGSLKPHQQFLQNKFPEITHLILAKNRGYSGGANAGLRAGFQKSPWVLFLTNDCQLQEFQPPTTEPALITPLIWARRKNKVDSIGGSFDIQKAQLRHCRELNEFQDSKNPYAPGTAFWIHQQVFEKAQGFDESLGTYWEDVDFSLRVRQLRFPLIADLKTQVLHAIGKTCHQDSHYTTYLYQRNRKRISLKHARLQGHSVLRTRLELFSSWILLAAKNIRKKNWARLHLLARAIFESRTKNF